MPRKTREISGTGIYHVMMRGTNKQNIFEDSEDYLRFMTILRNLTPCLSPCDTKKFRTLSRRTPVQANPTPDSPKVQRLLLFD